MFWVRLRSSIILTAILITFMVFGGLPLFLALALITFIGMMEYYRAVGIEKTGLAITAYILCALFLALTWFTTLDWGIAGALIWPDMWTLAFIMLCLSVLFAVYVLTFPKFNDRQMVYAFFGLIYVAVALSYIYKTRIMDDGAYLVWLIFLCSWGSDLSAYSFGMLFGKHKLTPVLSPKKSVEGAVGGVVGAAILGTVYALIFKEHLTEFSNPVLSVAILCAVGSVIAQIGDLAASAIKRNHDIKDYGTLIPGHGGILDRFDSVIFTAPIVYYLIVVLQLWG
ncbi:MAG: phosphatidate cytidylyltransferase [Lachnospiraceae bacterium]|nr:phosphatidate cytidylyltransferase [Lachnospiraceae bacterium]